MKTVLGRVLPVLLLLVPLMLGSAVLPASATPSTAAGPVARQPVPPELIGIRFGRHATFDRIVADFRGPLPENIRYEFVPRLVEDYTGRPVYIPGQVFLHLIIDGAAAHEPNGQLTYTGPRQFGTLGLGNVQGIAVTGDFELTLSFGFGMQRRSWVNAYFLPNTTRAVIDIGH